jgi:hypothetical protein
MAAAPSGAEKEKTPAEGVAAGVILFQRLAHGGALPVSHPRVALLLDGQAILTSRRVCNKPEQYGAQLLLR